MAENIYYVAVQPSIAHSSSSKSIQLNQLRQRGRVDRDWRNSQQININNSRSTSCPKTERSQYANTLQRFRHRSPKVELNALNYSTPRQPTKSTIKILSASNPQQSALSSAFNRASMQPVVRDSNKPRPVFKKVEQPQFRPKHIYRITP